MISNITAKTSKVLPTMMRRAAMSMSSSVTATMTTSTRYVSSPWLYNSLSFAAPEEAENAYIQSMLSPSEYRQWLDHTNDFSYIPSTEPIRTLQDALTSKHACIVTTITEPHSIVAVNDAWTDICGFTQDEVHHKSISSVLHGPLTNDNVIKRTMQRVQEKFINTSNNNDNETEDMYVVNYKKDRSTFINHVTISKILLSNDEQESGTYLLCGIIQPVKQVPLRMVL